MKKHSGKTAVITGGATGIGFATAKLLAAEGASVVLAGRNHSSGAAAVSEIERAGGRARFVRTDVRDDAQVEALVKAAAAERGAIDLWFNNAGTEGLVAPLEDVTDEIAAEMIAVNFKGVYSGIRHAARMIAPGGAIISNASFVGTAMPVPVAVAYGASKAAVLSMTKSAALALAEKNIRVFAVCPYIVDTAMVDRITGQRGPEARAGFAASFAPSGKLTLPEQVAKVVVDLYSGKLVAESGDTYLIDSSDVKRFE